MKRQPRQPSLSMCDRVFMAVSLCVKALTEYIVERLLLRDRVGPRSDKLTIHTRAPGIEDGLDECGELTSPRQASMLSVTSAAAASPPQQPAPRAERSGGARGGPSSNTTIRHRIPRTVKKVRWLFCPAERGREEDIAFFVCHQPCPCTACV